MSSKGSISGMKGGAKRALRVGVIGAGVMGQAVIRGLMRQQLVSASNVWAAARNRIL